MSCNIYAIVKNLIFLAKDERIDFKATEIELIMNNNFDIDFLYFCPRINIMLFYHC